MVRDNDRVGSPRGQGQPRVRGWALACLAGVGAVAAWLTLWPNGAVINRLVVRLYFDLGWHRVGKWLPLDSPDRFDFSNLLNVVLMVPIAALLVLAFPRMRPWWAGLAIFLASAAVELTQLLVLHGRVASWTDLVTNTAGGVLGALFGWLIAVKSTRMPEKASAN